MHPAACDRRPTARRIWAAITLTAAATAFVPGGAAQAHSGMPVTTMLRRTASRSASTASMATS